MLHAVRISKHKGEARAEVAHFSTLIFYSVISMLLCNKNFHYGYS